MKITKRILSIVLSLCMAFAVASTAAAEADISEHVDLVFYVMGDAPQAEAEVEDAINAVLGEKFNVTLDFQFSTWTDWTQKYNNTLTAGGADLIYIANWINYGTLSKAGAFLELDDLMNAYAPELRALAGEDMLNMCRVDGELYAVPALWPEYVPNGIKYREDLRVKYDLPVPDSIENMEAYFAGVLANEPTQTILRVTSGESTGLQAAFDAINVINIKYPWVTNNGFPYGLTANYDTPADIYDYWYSDDFVADCKLMKKWADMGFWSKSALSDVNDSEAYDNGVCIAEVGGMNPNKQISSAANFITNGHPEWESAYIAYGEVTGVMYPGHATQNGTAIPRSCKNPERAMMVLNYLMTDQDMNNLVQYGVKGVHYDVVDGMYKNLNEDFRYENFNTWNLRVNEYKLMQESDVVLQAMFDKYNLIAQKTKFPNVNIYSGFTEDYTDYDTERTAVSNVMRQYLAPLQAGLVDDVDAAVAEFYQKIEEAGIQACRDGFTEQWLAYCEEYSYK